MQPADVRAPVPVPVPVPVQASVQASGPTSQGKRPVREPDQGLVRDHAVPAWLSRPGDRLAVYASSIGLERWARIAAVAISPLLLVERGFATAALPLLGLVVYVAVTSLVPRNRYLRGADLLVAAALIVLAGSESVVFLPFLLVAVAGPAARGGITAGALAGTSLALLAVLRLAVDGELAVTGVTGVLPLTLLLVLAGVTTAIASQVRDDQAVRDRLTLQHAHRILRELRDLSADLPGGLDDRSIAHATLTEVQHLPGVQVVMVLGPDHGRVRTLAVEGTGGRLPRPMDTERLTGLLDSDHVIRSAEDLPPELTEPVGGRLRWLVRQLGQDTPPHVLVVGFRPPAPDRASLARLDTVAQDSGVALDNARLFDDTRRLAQRAARRRVAAELHDGVAQSLTHLRMELELLARDRADEHERDELARLARVATTALEDLRSTIADLRTPGNGDLGRMIERHLDDVRTSHGPQLEFDRQPGLELDPDQAEVALRAVQEAVSNAIQHADATRVRVRLRRDGDRLHLDVADDGRGGIAARAPHAAGDDATPAVRGVGLDSLHERAQRLRGELTISEPADGGTLITLRFPLDDAGGDGSPPAVDARDGATGPADPAALTGDGGAARKETR